MGDGITYKLELSSIEIGIVGDRGEQHIELIGETEHDLNVIRLSASGARKLSMQLLILANTMDALAANEKRWHG